MEDQGEGDDYLVWRQKDHLLAAVNRFNVVSFWNSLTGQLIHKKVLEENDSIKQAYKYRCYDYQSRY